LCQEIFSAAVRHAYELQFRTSINIRNKVSLTAGEMQTVKHLAGANFVCNRTPAATAILKTEIKDTLCI
jgi:hypothetical protein